MGEDDKYSEEKMRPKFRKTQAECDHKTAKTGVSTIANWDFHQMDPSTRTTRTEKTQNRYCHQCGTHWLRGKEICADDWYEWINANEGDK